MSDRNKLLVAVHHIREYCKANQIVGSFTLVGREGMAENHLMFDAPWCKLHITSDAKDFTALRLKHKRDEPEEELADTLGALSVLAQLMAETSINLLEVSKIMDREVGATHTPIYKDGKP
jgi:hypothetical protein